MRALQRQFISPQHREPLHFQLAGFALFPKHIASPLQQLQTLRLIKIKVLPQRAHIRIIEPIRRVLLLLGQTNLPICHATPGIRLNCPNNVVDRIHILQKPRDPLQPIRNLAADRVKIHPAALLKVSELRNLQPIEHHLPAHAPRAARRPLPVVFFKFQVVVLQVDAHGLERLEIQLLHVLGRNISLTKYAEPSIRKQLGRIRLHAQEAGMPIPGEPIFFLKANTALSGPNDPVEKPRGSTKLDWEVEIAAIIGTRAKYVSEADALNHIAGYCVCNDVSERNFQLERLGQWTKGKSHDTFGPLGPWLVTRDEIPDVQKLSLWLDVNGERRQTGSTSTMIFTMAKCISYVSQFMTLLPGDIVTTGTPPGVGTGMKPPKFLNVGDVVTLGIEGLGEQRQQIVAA